VGFEQIAQCLFTVGWWRAIVCNAFRMKQSYSMPGPVSTAMGDCLRAGKTIAPASPSLAQRATKGMSSHATDLAVYAESSSSSSYLQCLT